MMVLEEVISSLVFSIPTVKSNSLFIEKLDRVSALLG